MWLKPERRPWTTTLLQLSPDHGLDREPSELHPVTEHDVNFSGSGCKPQASSNLALKPTLTTNTPAVSRPSCDAVACSCAGAAHGAGAFPEHEEAAPRDGQLFEGGRPLRQLVPAGLHRPAPEGVPPVTLIAARPWGQPLVNSTCHHLQWIQTLRGRHSGPAMMLRQRYVLNVIAACCAQRACRRHPPPSCQRVIRPSWALPQIFLFLLSTTLLVRQCDTSSHAICRLGTQGAVIQHIACWSPMSPTGS